MLSSVANYLFGTTEEPAVTEAKPDVPVPVKEDNSVPGSESCHTVDLTTSPADDHDWELVDRISDPLSGHDKGSCTCVALSPSPSGNQRLCQLTQPAESGSRVVCDAHSPTNSSTPSEGGSSDHEGWLITPPRCFTAGGSTEDMEVSPLENLLIEHPSMSVYHKNSDSSMADKDCDSTQVCPASSRLKGKQNKKQVASHPPRRAKAVAERAGILVQVQANKTSQRQKQKVGARKNTKKAIERQNRAKEFKSQGKHRNCTGRKMNRSGRMAIRAC